MATAGRKTGNGLGQRFYMPGGESDKALSDARAELREALYKVIDREAEIRELRSDLKLMQIQYINAMHAVRSMRQRLAYYEPGLTTTAERNHEEVMRWLADRTG